MANILVVDDTKDLLDATKELVILLGHTTFTATNGVEALAHIDTHGNPDLVLSDVEMPNMNGIELARNLHERGINYFLMSGKPYETVAQWMDGELPREQFIQKPYRLTELMNVLSEYQ